MRACLTRPLIPGPFWLPLRGSAVPAGNSSLTDVFTGLFEFFHYALDVDACRLRIRTVLEPIRFLWAR